MRITKIVAAVRSFVRRFFPFARRPASHASPADLVRIPEPSPKMPGDVGSDPEQRQAGESLRDEPSDDQPEVTPLVEDVDPLESKLTSPEPPSDQVDLEQGPSLSNCDADVLAPSGLEETEPDETSPVIQLADDHKEPNPPKTRESLGNDKPDGSDLKGKRAGSDRRSKRGPRQIPGKRGPQSGYNGKGAEQAQSPPSRPELVCRKLPSSATWEIILTADDECQLTAVHIGDQPLHITDRQCRVPSLRGSLTLSFRDKQKQVVPLFEGGPLIFKLKKDWAGEGRKIARVTSGHFIVIAPTTWERSGHAPVEPDNCADPDFRSHYFYRDAAESDQHAEGFLEWSDSLIATGLELTGHHIYDNSDDGDLLVGNAPNLKLSPSAEWARVGEEAQHGWGQNFLVNQQSLSEVLDGKEGRFFLRVYDSDVRMLDSVAFRYLHNLDQILVNGARYEATTALVPSSAGYSPAEVLFVGTDGSTLDPVLSSQAPQYKAPSGAIVVPPHPDADHLSCNLGSNAQVTIVLDLPRLWWRLEDDHHGPGAWHDTPILMTRQEFQQYANANGELSLLSRRIDSVRTGFDDELKQRYRRLVEDDHIAIPLIHFVDYVQIDQRLNRDAQFSVEWAGKTVPLIVISADPIPEIVSFAAKPTKIVVGQEALLKWTTLNAGDARVAVDPELGVAASNGACSICPTETTTYTLSLITSGVEEISRSVTVIVESPVEFGQRLVPGVLSSSGKWRTGKGFSCGELRDAGLTTTMAVDRSIPIDRRRRTSHRANVEVIRSGLNG